MLLLVYTLLFSYDDFSQVNFSNSDGIFTALLTGIAAFATNLSTYWILGNSGVITFAVLGKTKLCFTMIGAFLIFRDPFHWNQILGISITLIGVFLFTLAKIVQKKRQKAVNVISIDRNHKLVGSV